MAKIRIDQDQRRMMPTKVSGGSRFQPMVRSELQASERGSSSAATIWDGGCVVISAIMDRFLSPASLPLLKRLTKALSQPLAPPFGIVGAVGIAVDSAVFCL